MGIEKNLADFLSSDVEAVVASERNYATRYNRQSEPRAILLAGQRCGWNTSFLERTKDR